MSTEQRTRGTLAAGRRRRRFVGAFAVVLAVLVVASVLGASASVAQGPRVTNVDVDPQASIAGSGSRLIFTVSERVDPVDPAQVQVSPATPFTVDTSGRSVGVRFALPLRDDTDYTVRIPGVVGAGGGGPASELTYTLRTPPLQLYILRRGADGDTIFRTSLDGTSAVPVYQAPHIEDFRATATHLAISLRGDDDLSSLVVTDLDGRQPRELPLPGEGYISNLQSADRGDVIGYTYSDRSLSAAGGQESALYTTTVRDADVQPTRVAIAGLDARIADWRFVPDTDRILLLSFDGSLLLAGATGGDPTLLGTAVAIDGIARGSSVAVVERVEGMRTVDLTTGAEAELVPATGVTGQMSRVTPLPGEGAGTVRAYSVIGDRGIALGTSILRVSDDGAPTPLFEAPGTDAVVQTCVSPSGRYVAVLVAPDIVSNPYDAYRLPLPATLETHIVEADSGTEVSALGGFDTSWCQVPPQ